MAQFVLKIEKLSHIIGARASRDWRSPSPIMALAKRFSFSSCSSFFSQNLPRSYLGLWTVVVVVVPVAVRAVWAAELRCVEWILGSLKDLQSRIWGLKAWFSLKRNFKWRNSGGFRPWAKRKWDVFLFFACPAGFSSFCDFLPKIREGGGGPRTPPLDPPLLNFRLDTYLRRGYCRRSRVSSEESFVCASLML